MAKRKTCPGNSTQKRAQKIVLEKSHSKTVLEKLGATARGKNRKMALDRNSQMRFIGTSRNSLGRSGLSVGTRICPLETKILRADVRAHQKSAKNIVNLH